MERSFPNGPYERIFSGPDRPEIFRPGGFELTRRALEFCAFSEGSAILDLGCGTGATVALMRDEYRLDASGVDPLAGRIRAADGDPSQRPIYRGTGKEVPFPDGRFAGVFTECSLSVMGDTERVLAEANRILIPGGLLAVSDLYIREDDRTVVSGTVASGYLAGTCLGGALQKERFLEYIKGAGFSSLLWEDHTDLLHRFLAEQIMKRGSYREVIELLVPGISCGTCASGAASGTVKFGYFLFIGQKDR